MIEIKEGTVVKLICGDRDRVGEISTVKNIEPSGRCEFHGSCDYCFGNISSIGEVNDGSKYDYLFIK